MPRPRTQPLPRGVYRRVYASGRIAYWISYVDAAGERQRKFGGDSIAEAQRAHAKAELAARSGEVVEENVGNDTQTLAAYSKRWLARRAKEGGTTYEREAQLVRDWILPKVGPIHLGPVRLCDLRPRDVAAWIDAQEGKRAPKSILNTHGVLSTMLERARFDELIVSNVAKGLPAGTLPKNVRVREVASWTRDEVRRLISDERIPLEHRVAHAIAAYTGVRLGELAGLRWGDLDTKARPLWRWTLLTQWDRKKLKTDQPRDVPLHPELQRTLEEWRAGGWSKLVCRVPRSSDVVIPRVDGTHDGTMHTKGTLGAKSVHRWAKLVGVDVTARDFHSFRRFMVTHARVDGARDLYLERITHNAKGEMIDGYTYLEWPELCEAASALRLEVPRGQADVVVLAPVAVGDAVRVQPSAGSDTGNSSTVSESIQPSGFHPRPGTPRIVFDAPPIREDPRGAGTIGHTNRSHAAAMAAPPPVFQGAGAWRRRESNPPEISDPRGSQRRSTEIGPIRTSASDPPKTAAIRGIQGSGTRVTEAPAVRLVRRE